VSFDQGTFDKSLLARVKHASDVQDAGLEDRYARTDVKLDRAAGVVINVPITYHNLRLYTVLTTRENGA
jgi:hypothetical protein